MDWSGFDFHQCQRPCLYAGVRRACVPVCPCVCAPVSLCTCVPVYLFLWCPSLCARVSVCARVSLCTSFPVWPCLCASVSMSRCFSRRWFRCTHASLPLSLSGLPCFGNRVGTHIHVYMKNNNDIYHGRAAAVPSAYRI